MNENHHNITINNTNIFCSPLQRSSSKVTASYNQIEVESISNTMAKTAIKTTMKNAVAPSPPAPASASPKNAVSSSKEVNDNSCTCQAINDVTNTNQQPLFSETKRVLSEKARYEVETKFAGILPRHDFALYRLGQFPKFASEELTLGKKLGQGEFGIIKEVRDVKLHQEDETRDDSDEQHESLSGRVSNVVGRQDDEQTAMETITDEECRLFIQHFCLRTTTKSKDETKQDEDEGSTSDTSNPIKRFFSFDWANNLMTNPYSNKPKGAGGIVTARYAIKQQKQLCCTTSKQFYDSVRDMATEAYLLAALEHPFILKLRAVSTAPMGSEHFFVIVDRLVGTLDDKLQNEWLKTQETLQKSAKHKALASALSITGSRSSRQAKQARKEQRRDFLKERLQVAKDLTSAIKYLHQNHIMDRDLKPHNIGFDIRGDVKLFDFGLSTVFTSSSDNKKHTARTGSILYMAPENYFGQYYDESVDIYSLAYIIWEIIHLQELFPNYKSISLLEAHVLRGGDRPKVVNQNNKTAAGAMLLHNGGQRQSQIPHLLEQMWHVNPKERPNADGVYAILKKELHVLKAIRGEPMSTTPTNKTSKVTDNNDDDEQRNSDINIRRSSCFQERFNRASLVANELLLSAQNPTTDARTSAVAINDDSTTATATDTMIPVGSFPCTRASNNTISANNGPNINNDSDCVQRRRTGDHKKKIDNSDDKSNHHERDLQIIHALMGGSSSNDETNQDFVELFCV